MVTADGKQPQTADKENSIMKSLLILAGAALTVSLTCGIAEAADLQLPSSVTAAASLQPGGLAVTPNVSIFGRRIPLPPRGGKVTPPDRPPVVTNISPGLSDQAKDDGERGHGNPSNLNLRVFQRADGTFLRN
jgi:hypothetical protein